MHGTLLALDGGPLYATWQRATLHPNCGLGRKTTPSGEAPKMGECFSQATWRAPQVARPCPACGRTKGKRAWAGVLPGVLLFHNFALAASPARTTEGAPLCLI